MADWPGIPAAGCFVESDAYVAVTPNATANVEGGWVEIIAATDFEASFVVVTVSQNIQSAIHDYLVDIGIGAAASEKILIPDLHVSAYGVAATNYTWNVYEFPLAVPKGSRISARAQSSGGANGLHVSVHLFGGGFLSPAPLGVVEAWGSSSADSGGTSIDPGGTINTKGAWVQLTAATAFDIHVLGVALGNQRNTGRTFCDWKIDIGIGAAASEKGLVLDLPLRAQTGADNVHPTTYPLLPVSIPKGSRVSARAECTISDATDRLFDIIAYGTG